MERAGEQEVTDEDRGLVAEHGVGRGARPRRELARIDHVVVQQGGGVDELDAGGEARVPGPRVAAQLGGGQGQQRAQPFAAGGDDVRGELRDERDPAVHPRHDRAVAGRNIVLDQGGENVQSILVAAGTDMIRGSSGGLGQAGGNAQIRLPGLRGVRGRAPYWRAGNWVKPRRRNCRVRVVVTTNNMVRLSFLHALLADAGITATVLDTHASAIEGSIGAIPRRLVVAAEDEARARRVLVEAGEA